MTDPSWAFQLTDRLPLPAPALLLEMLLFFSFYLHLLAVNFLLGGGIIAWFSAWYAGRWGTARHRQLAAGLARSMPGAMALTVALGMAPFLFVQLLYGPFFLTAAHLLAWPWCVALVLLLAAYAGWHLAAWNRARLGPHLLWVSGASAFGVALVALAFTANALLMTRPALHNASASWLVHFYQDPSLLARWLHHLISAVAFAGLYIALYGLWRMRRGQIEDGYWIFRQGLNWFLIATLIDFTAGTWLLASLGERREFLGAHPERTFVMVSGIVTSLIGFILLLASRAALHPSRWAGPGAAFMFVSAGLMVLAQDAVRRGRLEGLYNPAAVGVSSQWSPVFGFLVLSVLGLMTVGMMLWLCLRLPFQPRIESR